MVQLFELFITFLKIGLFSFGGGYAMIPLMKTEVVQIHQWLTLPQMVDIIVLSQMLPGAIAINLATFVGFTTAGLLGALSAAFGVVLPSFVIVLSIARSYSKFKELDIVQRVFKGIRPMSVAMVSTAAFLIAQTSLIDAQTVVIGVISLLVFKFTKVSPVLVIVAAGFSGIILFG